MHYHASFLVNILLWKSLEIENSKCVMICYQVHSIYPLKSWKVVHGSFMAVPQFWICTSGQLMFCYHHVILLQFYSFNSSIIVPFTLIVSYLNNSVVASEGRNQLSYDLDLNYYIIVDWIMAWHSFNQLLFWLTLF